MRERHEHKPLDLKKLDGQRESTTFKDGFPSVEEFFELVKKRFSDDYSQGRVLKNSFGEMVAAEFTADEGDVIWVCVEVSENHGEYEETSARYEIQAHMSEGGIETLGVFSVADSKLNQFISLDRMAKSITGRMPTSYAREFKLPMKEIFPKTGDTLVVGDPYQNCDFENVTILDYEYVDEVHPPFLDFALDALKNGTVDEEKLKNDLKYWYAEFHRGNQMAVNMRYGIYKAAGVHATADPVMLFVEQMREYQINFVLENLKKLADTGSLEVEGAQLEKQIKDSRQFMALVLDGTWDVRAFKQFLSRELTDVEEKELSDFFDMESHYSSELREHLEQKWKQGWYEYFERARKAIQQEVSEKGSETESGTDIFFRAIGGEFDGLVVPMNSTRTNLDEYSEEERIQICDTLRNHLDQMKGLVDQLPGIASSERRKLLEGKLMNLFYNVNYLGLEDSLIDEHIEDNRFNPVGSNYNKRVIDYIRMVFSELESTRNYFQTHLRQLLSEKQRVDDLMGEATLSDDTMHQYLASFDYAFRKEKFQKRAKKAHVLHGFFPESVPPVDKKFDRIVALYSTSTHVWDHYSTPEEFYSNLLRSIEYLKDGGKYILGPINWKLHRMRERDNWDGEGQFSGEALMEALCRLRDEGLINFSFIKDERNGSSGESDSFRQSDSASCLIIEKR